MQPTYIILPRSQWGAPTIFPGEQDNIASPVKKRLNIFGTIAKDIQRGLCKNKRLNKLRNIASTLSI